MPEDQVARGDGSPTPSPNRTPAEDPTGIRAVLRSLARLFADFAERRETLTETLERDIGFRAAFECATDAILIADDHGWCVDANPAAAHLLGVPDRDEFLNRRVTDFAPPEARDQAAADWRLLIADGEQFREVVWQSLQGGRRRFAFAARANVRRGRHLLVLRDVTDKRHLERELFARARGLNLVARLGVRALTGESWRDLAAKATQELAGILDAPLAAAFELPAGTHDLVLRAAYGCPASQIGAVRIRDSTASLEGVALNAGEPIVANDLATDARFAASSFARGRGAVNGIAAAIPGRTRPVGVLALYGSQPRIWSDADLDLLQAVAINLAGPLDRRSTVATIGTGPLREAVPTSSPTYRALIHHDPELALTIAADGVIRYASPASERVLGLLPEEVNGRDLLELIHPDDRSVISALLAYCRSVPGGAGPAEVRFAHRDGGWAWLEIVARDLLADARVGGILVSAREVTARRRVEESRRRADERFARIFRAFPAGVVVTTLDDGRVIEVNERFLTMLGYTRDEVVGRSSFDLGIWSDPADRAVLVRRLQEHETIQELDVRIATKSGDSRHAIVSVGQISLDGEPCLIVLVNDVTDRKNAEGQLHRLAHTDALTGLSNRPHFLSAVGRALDQAEALPDRQVAILFLDLDGFKSVNDRFGHDAGDRILEEVARRLSSSLRAGDLAARYGGDEFTVLLSRIGSATEAAAVAERIIAALAASYAVDETRITLSVSIGIAVGGAGTTAGALLREADIALYHAKRRGRANYVFFEPGMRGGAIADANGGDAVHRSAE